MLRSRVPSLDGLRGLAVVAVLGYHAAPATFSGGFLGVDVFFVLSGYLLTSWLLREHRRTGSVDVHTYAVRRVRRIAPALLVLLAALAVVAPVLAPGSLDGLQRDLIWSAVGLTNWHLIADGASYFSRFGGPSLVRHLWSVAIEIQFYVACPFLVGWLIRRRRGIAVGALLLGIGASAVRMAVLARGADTSRAYFGTDTRASALLVGVLVAVLTESPATRNRRLRQHPTLAAAPAWARRTAVGALALFAIAVVAIDDRTTFLYRGGFLLAELATAIVIYAALHRGSAARLLGRRPLRWLGERSYGIYLWHWPIVVMLRPHGAAERPVLTVLVVSVAAALVLGDLSYRLVEQPLLARRRSSGLVPRRGMAHATALVAGIAVVGTLAIVRTPSGSSLASSLRAGQRVLAQTRAAAAAAAEAAPVLPATTPSSTPGPTDAAAPPAPAPAPPPPTAPAKVVMIGDSVMISAASALRARLAPETVIDARQGRQFLDAASVLRGMRANGELGGVVVLALGNNGPVTVHEVDQVMAELGDVKQVFIVTTRVGRQWQNAVNDVLRNAVFRYPVATLVDWWTASADHPEWFQRDGTHFPTTEGPGATAYADLLATALNP